METLKKLATVEEDGMKALVALVATGGDKQKEDARAALLDLASEYHEEIIKAGGIAPLLDLVKDHWNKQNLKMYDALSVLSKLAGRNDMAKRKIIENDGVELLRKLTKDEIAWYPDPRAIRWLAGSLLEPTLRIHGPSTA